jgi:hypothetical protein
MKRNSLKKVEMIRFWEMGKKEPEGHFDPGVKGKDLLLNGNHSIK